MWDLSILSFEEAAEEYSVNVCLELKSLTDFALSFTAACFHPHKSYLIGWFLVFLVIILFFVFILSLVFSLSAPDPGIIDHTFCENWEFNRR